MSGIAATLPKPGTGIRGEAGRIGYLLRQAQVAARNGFDRALAEFGLTLPQFSAMTIVDAYDGLSSADLARLSMLTPQTVNQVVRTLEDRGLVRRTAHAVHGRVLCLSLTGAGKALLPKARRRVYRIEKQMVAGLPRRDEAVIRRWLVGIASAFPPR